ncbi:stage III sporulation protein AE [Garciella nitratireducens]|uniref:stage III sporulation protein AE n=1 Tax=Garciella nitratireducens TaxID=218205 RepID=UPI000DE87259|nr:stage III sporulation protein AE [Garciella nitratireducens]RBP46663.1 stage III sporulation protein AE [Garciella nitratireducens]
MKKFIFILLIILLFIPTIAMAKEENQEENINLGQLVDELLNQIDIYDVENIIGNINEDVEGYLPKFNVRDMISSIAKGELNFNMKDFFTGIGKYLFNEVNTNINLLLRIILLSIICAILQNFQNTFDNTVSELAFNIVYMIILVMAIQSFTISIQIGIDVIDKMVTFMQALLPILLSLLTSMGSITSSALFKPLVILTVSTLSTFIKNIIIPMIFCGGILNLINHISEKIQISKLSGLLKQTSIVLLGFVMTVFVGVISIQGIASSSFDGITARTAKYAIDNFVPVIGGFLSEAADTVMGCSLLIKNAIGIIGLIFLFIVMLFPIIKILSIIIIYKISAAIIEPIADGRIVNSLNDISKSLTLILASIISVGIMFFLVITIIIGTGNATVMMR